MLKSIYRNSSKNYFFNACFDKNQLKNLISWLIKQSGEKITVDFLETLKQTGFHQATLAGVSLGLDDLQIPSQKPSLISQAKMDVSFIEYQTLCGNLTSVEKSQRMISTWNQTSDMLRNAAVQHFKNTNPVNPVYMMAFSGARGNISQVRQLVAMRGLMADPQGVILEFPIQSNFREGLTITEYLISCYGARKGLVDTALRTATSGYLTRRLVDAAQHVIVSIKDCGTKQGLRLRNTDLENQLIGRVLAKDLLIHENFSLKTNQIISPPLAKLISKKVKQVFVRSPLTCEAEKSICQLCYGWNLAHGNLVSIGDAVGVLAAQSIGEPGTQLTMRTFHTGGVGVFSDQAMKIFVSPCDGVIDYSQGLSGHFVRTPHGKIVYMIKNTSTTTQNIILQVRSLQTRQINYSLKKQDLPPGSVLLVRHGEHVKTGQLLAQSSKIKKSTQKLPESTHPVFSPLDGEIYFESITILKQKQIQKTKKATKTKTKTKTKEKEIGRPDIRTVKGLGNFWVFSSKNQQELYTAKSFLRPGDLVSPKSSIFQYDFYSTTRSIFQLIENKVGLGINIVQLPVEKINFHKVAYSMVLNNPSLFTKKKFSTSSTSFPFSYFNYISKKPGFLETTTELVRSKSFLEQEFLFFTKKRLQNFLIWFPNGSYIYNSGYFLNFLLYSKINNKPITNSSVLFNKYTKNNTWFTGNLFFFKTSIQKWRIMSPVYFKNTSISYFLNLKNQKVLTYQGIEHYKSQNTIFSNKFVSQNVKQVQQKNRKINTKFFYCTQKNYLINHVSSTHTDFVNQALKKVKSSVLAFSNSNSSWLFFQEKTGWIYVPNTKKIITKNKTTQKSKTKSFVLEQGKLFDNLLFLNKKVCIEYISTNKIGLVKLFNNKKISPHKQHFLEQDSGTLWYSWQSFLQQNSFLTHKKQYTSFNSFDFSGEKNSHNFSKNSSKCFLYYKIRNLDLKRNQQNINFVPFQKALLFGQTKFLERPLVKKIKQNYQNKTQFFGFVYLLNEYTLPKKQDLNNQWIQMKKVDTNCLTNSPLFTKQKPTLFEKNKKITKRFQLIISLSGGWFSCKNIFKLLINLNSQSVFNKVNQSYLLSHSLKNSKIPIAGINLFAYNLISLPVPEKVSFYFEIFENQWVLPTNKLTTGFIKINTFGEFRRFKSIKDSSSLCCILTTSDLITLDLSKIMNKSNTKNFTQTKQLTIGNVLRAGTELFPSSALSVGGFILNKNFNHVTIRLGLPFLASARGIIHIFHKDLIQKNDLLITLKSRRLQTEDIVQGIPRIEQLFEARETQGGVVIPNNVHTRLKKYFVSSLKSKKASQNTLPSSALSQAVNESLNKIQFFLVQSILQAYSSQGVKISQKHIEIIVRQMTTRVRILSGGHSGFLPGELIQFTRIQKLNEQLSLLGKRPALYEPLILGITKSVLQSESFLLSASFQEVSRVLVRSALTKKTDFLRGLHENVILGQLVPTGTGLISILPKKPLTKKQTPSLKKLKKQLAKKIN